MDRYDSACDKYNDLARKKDDVDLDDFEEFMRKVEEVNKMVHALASGDKAEIEEATKSADTWLANQKRETSGTTYDTVEELIHDPSSEGGDATRPKKKITSINPRKSSPRKPSENLDNLNSETMSQEAFMKAVEEDANKRSEDRRKRIKESDAIRVKANRAFREGDMEKALDLYNKAIDVRKDSCVLYSNRALTLLNLELYTRALKDAETALRLEENNFKAKLYKWHALHKMGEDEQAKECLSDIKSSFPKFLSEIEEYEKEVYDEESDET